MFRTALVALAACLALGLAAPAHADPMDDFSKTSSGSDTQKKNTVCGKAGFCRAWNGMRCAASKNFFSACQLICKKEEGFAESQCARKAKAMFGFDGRVYTKAGDEGGAGEKPVDHLARQVSKGGKGMKAFCNLVVVGHTAKTLFADMNAPAEKGSFSKLNSVCKRVATVPRAEQTTTP